MSGIFFIDLEATGLSQSSWPIEVGWCALSGSPTSFLIAPDPDWPLEAWDEAAEELHGIALEHLHQNGRPAADVCHALNKALASQTVISDAPDWDAFWLYRLFAAGAVKQEFALVDFAEQFPGLPEGEFRKASASASIDTPHIHRAEADVLHMRAVYHAIKSGH